MLDWLKSWVKPILVGLGLGAAIAGGLTAARGIAAIDILMQWLVQKAFGDVAQLASNLDKAGAPAWFARALAFAIGPGLPVAAGTASTVLLVPALRLKLAGRPVVERAWPGPPDILDRRLARPRVDLTDPYAPGRPLLGRETEMQRLMRFAGAASGETAILALTGVEGMGKTRVALAWLMRLQALG